VGWHSQVGVLFGQCGGDQVQVGLVWFGCMANQTVIF
jgi:hypothetical protein